MLLTVIRAFSARVEENVLVDVVPASEPLDGEIANGKGLLG